MVIRLSIALGLCFAYYLLNTITVYKIYALMGTTIKGMCVVPVVRYVKLILNWFNEGDTWLHGKKRRVWVMVLLYSSSSLVFLIPYVGWALTAALRYYSLMPVITQLYVELDDSEEYDVYAISSLSVLFPLIMDIKFFSYKLKDYGV